MNRITNGAGNNSSRDDWRTPQWLFDILNSQYNFELDCCANATNKKRTIYSDDFEKEVYGYMYLTGWMNPPFSIADRMFKHFFKVLRQGVAVYRCDNLETKIWQEIILPKASWVFIPNKRIKYEGFGGAGSRFPSALIGLNLPEPKMIDGTTLKVLR